MKKGKNLFGISVILLFTLAFCFSVVTAFYSAAASFIELALTITAFIVLIVFMKFAKRDAFSFFESLSHKISPQSREELASLSFPACAVNELGEIVWYNVPFSIDVLGGENALGESFDECFKSEEKSGLCKNSKRFSSLSMSLESGKESYSVYYFIDDTELKESFDEFLRRKPSAVQIVIDNYDELTNSLSGSEKNLIVGKIESVLESIFVNQSNGFFRKTDKDRFVAVIDDEHLSLLIATKFKALEQINLSGENKKIIPTLSIGIGKDAANLFSSDAMASQALDMALGRGGDQVALKSEHGYEFFGGRQNGSEKRAKVRSRMIALALSEMFAECDNVFVMGHKMADFDCLGAAVGLHKAAAYCGKSSYIVIDRDKNLSKALIAELTKNGYENALISPEKAKTLVRPNSLLIIADTHNPDFTECPELIELVKNIAVVDHHRKMVNHITGTSIFYHEPTASSTCEMVTELLQYFGDGLKISKTEAMALLSGIMLDTKNFIIKSGVRTFEAAAYLRKIGADLISVNAWFANSLETYYQKASLISGAEIYKGCAISFKDEFTSELLLAVPQTADELLHIKDVRAAFVMYKKEGVVSLSARSYGSINVQLIAEKLGGGGHLTMAGAQIAAESCIEVKEKLLEAIDDYLEENTQE